MKLTLPVLIRLALSVTPSFVHAQLVNDGNANLLTTVTNTVAGDVTVGTNGSFTLLLLSDDSLLTNSANGVIGRNATARSNEVRLVSATGRWFMGSDLLVGNNGAFNRLAIHNGGRVDDHTGILGGGASSTNNFAVVTGPGSSWNSALELRVGDFGAGNQLVVSNGALARNNYGVLGRAGTSTNNQAVVTGLGSVWSNFHELYVGNDGAGNRLMVSNGGVVLAVEAVYVGFNPTSTNNLALVDGGSLRATNAAGTALLEVRRGTNVINSGLIVVDQLVVTNSQGFFEFNGGTVRIRDTSIANGAVFAVGNGVSPATFELVGAGTHRFANNMIVSANGLLKGNGTVLGDVFVAGSLMPGASVGQLAIAGSLTFGSGGTAFFELNKAAGTYDKVVGLSNLLYQGTLIVTNLAGTLANGDRFKLFEFTSRQASSFTTLVLPALAPGLKWRNKLMMDGSLEVLAIPSRDFGMDVSHFQGSSGISQASWAQMFAEGKRFVFIKATEGLTGPHDGAMSNNVARAVAAGLLAGVYHFAHPENRPTTNGAILEASNMLVYAGSAVGPGRLRPVLDIEGNATTLSTTALTDWVIAFSDEIIARRGPGAAPIIYCSQSAANFEFDSRLAHYDLWLRTIGGSDPATDDPVNSLGFDPTGVFNEWSFWQYSDTGSSGGISPLDLNVCHSEYKPLSSYLIPTPPPASIRLTGAAISGGGGAFAFSFTNTPGALFTVLATTNVALPFSSWTVLGAVMESPPGQFQFTDSQATNHPQRFYGVRSP